MKALPSMTMTAAEPSKRTSLSPLAIAGLTVGALLVAATLVLGCYAWSRYQAVTLPKKQGRAPYTLRSDPPKAELIEA